MSKSLGAGGEEAIAVERKGGKGVRGGWWMVGGRLISQDEWAVLFLARRGASPFHRRVALWTRVVA